MRRQALSAAVLAGMVTLGLAAPSTGAVAGSVMAAVVPAPPAITLSVAVGPVRTSTTAAGTGFTPWDRVAIYVGTNLAGGGETDSQGNFSGVGFQIPATTQPGRTPVLAVGSTDNLTAESVFTVRADWSQAAYNAGNTNFNPFENTLNRSNVTKLQPVWSAVSSGSARAPVIVGGLVIWQSGEGIRAFDAGSGSLIWTAPQYAEIADLVVGGGSVFVATGSRFKIQPLTLVALDLRTGRQRWVTPLQQTWPYFPVLTYGDGALYSIVSGGALVKYDADSGTPQWSHPYPFIFPEPRAAGFGLFYTVTASDNGSVVAYDATTGIQRWSRTFETRSISRMVLSGTRLVIAGTDQILSFDALSGTPQWKYAYYSPDPPTLAAGPKVIYTPLAALNAVTGTELFTFPARGSRIVANGLVYSNELFKVNLYDAVTGALIGPLSSDGGVTAIASGRLYMLTNGSGDTSVLLTFALPNTVASWVTLDDKVPASNPNRLTYSAGWSTATNPGDYRGTDSYTSPKGASASFTFSGTGFRLWYGAAAHHGIATVTADRPGPHGVIHTTFDLDQYSAIRRDGLTSTTSPLLPYATYTVHITATGRHNPKSTGSVISLDRIDLGRT